uniref:Uncharacterized protein n=1 Tax=Oryza glumipatula TaxID=40148 RepID=A0A0D9ZWL4_9ORYZ
MTAKGATTVRLGGRANSDKPPSGIDLVGGRGDAKDSGGDSARTGNPTRLRGGEGAAVPLPAIWEIGIIFSNSDRRAPSSISPSPRGNDKTFQRP